MHNLNPKLKANRRERERELTREVVELTVRSEISSTLGLKIANRELEEERRSLLSQGESCCVVLK